MTSFSQSSISHVTVGGGITCVANGREAAAGPLDGTGPSHFGTATVFAVLSTASSISSAALNLFCSHAAIAVFNRSAVYLPPVQIWSHRRHKKARPL